MTTLVVPVDVAALCVGRPDAERAKTLAPSADFSVLPYAAHGSVPKHGPYVSAAVLSAGAAFEGEVPFLPGIHVHWALPDGLTHGVQPEGKPLTFPSVPNRWLVTRIVSDEQGNAKLRSWVVESDRLSPEAVAPPGLEQPTVPLKPAPGQNYAFVGQAFPLETWAESPTAVPRLAPFTALGYGEPAFAALYPNCSTVFGLFDDLGDLDSSPATVAYHVAGWYADETADPLHGGAVDAADNQYHWTWDKDLHPTTTVCTGVIAGIQWDPGAQYLTESPGKLDVAIGGSTPEAAAALLAGQLASEGEPAAAAEQAINALQFGLLTQTGQVDALEAFEEAVHAAGFATVAGGPLWAVHAQAAGGEDTEEEVTLPDGVAADLNALNDLQTRLTALENEVRSRRRQLFADWYKYLLVTHSADDVPDGLHGRGREVQTYMRRQIATIEALGGPGGQTDALVQRMADKVKAIGAERPGGTALDQETVAPRYYRPADPVLVLSGDDITPAARYGGDGAGSPDGKLHCRGGGYLISEVGLDANAVPGTAQFSLAAGRLPGLPAPPPATPGPVLEALLREAVLVEPPLQPVVAAAIATQGGDGNPAVVDFAGTVSALRQAATGFTGGGSTSIGYTGENPAGPLIAEWTGTPWLPVLLQYEVELQPVASVAPGKEYSAGLVSGEFALSADGIDLHYTGSGVSAELHEYSGTVVLTPGATADLVNEIDQYTKQTGATDEVLAAVLQRIKDLPLLSQGLGGLGEALIMREQTLQMPVADPLAAPPDAPFVNAVAAAIGEENTVAPMPEASFNPLRAGLLRVRRLRLVDAFGRHRDYTDPRVVVARGLTPPDSAGPQAGDAFLAPRITQAARLMFRWLAAFDDDVETNSHPASSPILGWVVPNHLDRSLLLYGADGTALGAVGLSGDRRSTTWTPAPGGKFRPGTSIDTALADAHPHLLEFALAAFGDGDASFLGPFYEAVDDALRLALPASFREDAATAVLIGQPLVLARARLALDLAEPPANNESWDTFQTSVENGVPAYDDGGASGLGFPVVLGSLAQLNDTLVGYWLEESGQTDYGQFYAPAAKVAAGGVEPPTQYTLQVHPGRGGDPSRTVTVLMDPRGSVHATTGILPVKSIGLPPDQYAPALRSLAATFAATPVLAGSNRGDVALAQPKVVAGDWSWIQSAPPDWSTQPLTDATSQATLDYTPQRIVEGWLRLVPRKDEPR